ncbi:MAG TPA: hypothetical protein DCM86_19565 [Verrucomicrobiales bacterium]|nr:hypothetical protein [Verrucomicrobiales bacterium]
MPCGHEPEHFLLERLEAGNREAGGGRRLGRCRADQEEEKCGRDPEKDPVSERWDPCTTPSRVGMWLVGPQDHEAGASHRGRERASRESDCPGAMEGVSKGSPMPCRSYRFTGLIRAALVAATLGVTPILRAEPPPAASAATNGLHWAFAPIRMPALPDGGAQRGGEGNPIDAFVQARLAKAGLHPAPEADRATLIRRLSFDLLGLPPGPSEVEEFVRDPDPRAYGRLVERLLASPHYGEQWGRHWLDVVRYTESQGFEYDRLRENAWHYRDYVIASLNRDIPYDRFMREQVAGDVLEPATRDGIVATSLLVCGPYDEAGNAQANATQRMITREEEMEDLLSVVGQSFLGVTLNCARCHSHKFDPIPIDDYYRMKSVFDGVKHGERPIATSAEIRDRESRLEGVRQRIAAGEAAIGAIESEAWKQAYARRDPGAAGDTTPPRPALEFRFDTPEKERPAGSLEGGAVVAGGRLLLTNSGAFFRSAPIPRELREKTLEAWVSLEGLSQGGGAAISLEAPGGQVFDAIVFGERQPRKWVAGSEGFARTRDLSAPEEIVPPGVPVHVVAVYGGGNRVTLYRNGVPYGESYQPGSPLQTYKAGEARVLLGMRHTGGGRPFLRGEILKASVFDRALSAAEVGSLFRSSGAHVSREALEAAMTPEGRRERERLGREVEGARAELGSMPPLPVSYAGVRRQPEPTRRLRRGDVKTPEDVMVPGALSVIRTPSPEFGLPADAPEGERRRRFADWLASPENPLPARVMMNRVWQFHFGQGLVATPNDLGRSGSAPTHPELLDWLAATFIRSGWSLKAMHRLIVTSAAYRQSSRFDSASAAADADNLLLWRYAPRRLEAEMLRDAMLSVSGELNPAVGGPSFRSFDVLTFPANAYVPRDKTGPEFNRRSVYRMNVNSGKEPLMDAFDCPDPAVKTPRRGVTITPLQALALMNNSFVQRQAERLAARAKSVGGEGMADGVSTAYRLALGRSPTPQESAAAQGVSRDRGLLPICWALLNSTEFLYIQ